MKRIVDGKILFVVGLKIAWNEHYVLCVVRLIMQRTLQTWVDCSWSFLISIQRTMKSVMKPRLFFVQLFRGLKVFIIYIKFSWISVFMSRIVTKLCTPQIWIEKKLKTKINLTTRILLHTSWLQMTKRCLWKCRTCSHVVWHINNQDTSETN